MFVVELPEDEDLVCSHVRIIIPLLVGIELQEQALLAPGHEAVDLYRHDVLHLHRVRV